MAASCFCGCGRTVKGLRNRANNTIAGQVTEDLRTLNGALERAEVGGHSDAVATTVAEGQVILDGLTGYLHGSGSGSGRVDKGVTAAWLRAAKGLRRRLVTDSTTPPWLPSEIGTDVIANTGVRSPGVITDVRRIGGNEHVATLDLTVEVQDAGDEVVVLRRNASISVIQAPRVGDRVEVSYDPTDRSRFVHRTALER